MKAEELKEKLDEQTDDVFDTLMLNSIEDLTDEDAMNVWLAYRNLMARYVMDMACAKAFELTVKYYGGRSLYNKAERESTELVEGLLNKIAPERVREYLNAHFAFDLDTEDEDEDEEEDFEDDPEHIGKVLKDIFKRFYSKDED